MIRLLMRVELGKEVFPDVLSPRRTCIRPEQLKIARADGVNYTHSQYGLSLP